MQINVRLGKNFTTQYNKLQNEFGTEMAKLNGFDDGQLSYTDFIDNFIDEPTVADSSVDGNSNVKRKDIVTLLTEMPKPHRKLLAYNKIYHEIQKTFGFKAANEWLEMDYTSKLYLHDADTSTFKHYCVLPTECCEFLYKGRIIYASFEQLYGLLPDEEFLDEQQMVYYKKPKNLKVADLDIETGEKRYTKVTLISNKETDKDLYFVKAKNGFNLITTEDHSFITTNGEVHAEDLSKEDILYSNYSKDIFTDSLDEYAELELTSDLGYIVGMYLAEGYNDRGQMNICQNKIKSPQEWNNIISALERIGIPYSVDENRGRIRLKNGDNNWERKIFKMLYGKYANEKCLCPDFVHFNNDFLKGILCGIIDGDGTIADNRTLMIRLTSKTLINQIHLLGLHFGVYFGSRIPYIQSQTARIQQKQPMYSATVNMNRNRNFFLSLPCRKIKEKFTHFDYDEKYANKSYICKTGEIEIRDNCKTYKNTNKVFDLSTESHTFLCNGLLIHNCFAYDLKDLAERGLYFLDETFNPKPAKHLTTFVDFVKEFISYTSNLSSGACGLPNLIPYMYYFWKEDVKNDYLGIKTAKREKDYAIQNIQRFIYAINQPCTRDGQQSAFTNTSVFDRCYLEALFGGSEFPNGEFMIDYLEEIMNFQKLFLQVMSDIRSENMFTFPVNSISLIRKNGKFEDEKFAKYAIKHNMRWSDSNFFIDKDVTSLSNCCRLKGSVKDLGYFNSVGGSALKVGSVKVSTINLARIALDTNSEEEYLEELAHRALVNMRVLHVIRHIIQRNVEKGLLPNFNHNLVDFQHLYSTTGFIGIYESMKKFGYVTEDEFGNHFYTEEAANFGKKIFETMRQVSQQFLIDNNCDYMWNCEQIPGENAAAKLMKKDQFFYPDADIYDLPLYGNQFIPLGIKTTFQERVRIQAMFDSFCNGGSILHANIDAPFDSYEKAYKMTEYIADKGVTYFAFNTKIQACEDNHAFYGTTCPICGKPIATEYTRVVGFLTPIKSWSKERKNEYKMRRWEPLKNKNIKELE